MFDGEEAVAEYIFNSFCQLCKCGIVGLTKIWRACTKRHAKIFLWDASFTALPNFYLSFPTCFSIL